MKSTINGFCGPFAYGKVMGITSNEAALALSCWDWRLSEGNGKPAKSAAVVKGVLMHAMRQTLRAAGVILAEIEHPHMTLVKWAKNRQRWNDTKAWIVHVSGHYVVYRDGCIYDNNGTRTSPTGLPVEKHFSAKQRIKHAIQVSTWSDANPLRLA